MCVQARQRDARGGRSRPGMRARTPLSLSSRTQVMMLVGGAAGALGASSARVTQRAAAGRQPRLDHGCARLGLAWACRLPRCTPPRGACPACVHACSTTLRGAHAGSWTSAGLARAAAPQR